MIRNTSPPPPRRAARVRRRPSPKRDPRRHRSRSLCRRIARRAPTADRAPQPCADQGGDARRARAATRLGVVIAPDRSPTRKGVRGGWPAPVIVAAAAFQTTACVRGWDGPGGRDGRRSAAGGGDRNDDDGDGGAPPAGGRAGSRLRCSCQRRARGARPARCTLRGRAACGGASGWNLASSLRRKSELEQREPVYRDTTRVVPGISALLGKFPDSAPDEAKPLASDSFAEMTSTVSCWAQCSAASLFGGAS